MLEFLAKLALLWYLAPLFLMAAFSVLVVWTNWKAKRFRKKVWKEKNDV